MSASALAEAVAALDRVLAGRPASDGQAFSEAIQAVCRQRDLLRPSRSPDPRTGGGDPRDGARLGELNAAVTLLMAGRYPLGEIPWEALETLRGRLASLASESV